LMSRTDSLLAGGPGAGRAPDSSTCCANGVTYRSILMGSWIFLKTPFSTW
jgi:hypothetical protein